MRFTFSVQVSRNDQPPDQSADKQHDPSRRALTGEQVGHSGSVIDNPGRPIEMRLVDREEELHWFRRFFTSLAIGNGGAFAAIGAGIMQAESIGPAAQLGFWPISFFGAGTIFAGVIPAALWLDKQSQYWGTSENWTDRFSWSEVPWWRRIKKMWVMTAYGFAGVAMLLFTAGVGSTAYLVWSARSDRPADAVADRESSGGTKIKGGVPVRRD